MAIRPILAVPSGTHTDPFTVTIRFYDTDTNAYLSTAQASDFDPLTDINDLVLIEGPNLAIITNATGTGTTFTVTLEPVVGGHGDIILEVPANRLSQGNLVGASHPILVDGRGEEPLIASWGIPTTLPTATTLNLAIVFNQNVFSVATTDFSVQGNSQVQITGLTGTGTSYTLTLSLPTEATGTFTIDLVASSVRTGTSRDGPDITQHSPTITYDTRPIPRVLSWVLPSEIQTAATSVITLNFDHDITGLASSDFSFNHTNTSVTNISGSARAYQITVNLPQNIYSRMVLTLSANSVVHGTFTGPLEDSISPSFVFDTTGTTNRQPLERDNEYQILASTQTTSSTFADLVGLSQLTLTNHAGGTWVLQRQSPNNSAHWIDLDLSFVAEGSKIFYASPSTTYRLHGGTVGATAWLAIVHLKGVVHPSYSETILYSVPLIS